MASGAFKFEDDLLKHYVRINGWLPLCAARQERLQKRKPKLRRRLKYFTFCAVNAVDVLMLDIAKVIHRSVNDRFDTVYFFDKTPELVAQTQLRIPGSIGFAGSFVDTVLTPADVIDPLAAPTAERDTGPVRHKQILQATKQDLLNSFPFDVLNLDLQDIIFKSKDPFPGEVIQALRRVCEWQRRPLISPTWTESLDGFTLLFTTRVGPADLRDDYAQMLLARLRANIAADATLADLLTNRTGLEVHQLQHGDFRAFFELGVPKVIAAVLMDEDWHIETDPGILAFSFIRPGPPAYEILHFAMNVRRHSPPREQRAPGVVPAQVGVAYEAVARQLFMSPATPVTDETVANADLTPSLEDIKRRRRKYYPDAMA